MTLADIDFAALYREHMARVSERKKGAKDWDVRAPALSRTVSGSGSQYADAFLARMNFDGCATLLDVGCGPGAIALAASPRLERVYGLDFSQAMLDALTTHARDRGLVNIEPVLRAWEDDWSDVPVCDIAVASRSTMVTDLAAALAKLEAHARQRVYITMLAGGRFLGNEIYRAIGRDDEPMPDYIYAVNMLRQRGIHPDVAYLNGGNRLADCEDFADLARRVAWSLGELNERELAGLRDLYDRRGNAIGDRPMKWALVSWDVPEHS
jgi:SAM-dependent methyltransferase